VIPAVFPAVIPVFRVPDPSPAGNVVTDGNIIKKGDRMGTERFWQKAYDPGIGDLDPALWEDSYPDKVRPVFRKYADRTALHYMGTAISYKKLESCSDRFAHMLLENGMRKGDVVGIHLPNIPEFVIAWLGALKAGCAVTGVSPLLSTEEMVFQLNDSGARALVTLDALFAAKLVGVAHQIPALKVVVAAGIAGFLPKIKGFLGKLLKKIPTGEVKPIPGKTVLTMEQVIRGNRFSARPPDVSLTPDDLAYIMYTGGTTGAPKGAMLTHRNILADIEIVMQWMQLDPKGGTCLSAYPMFHIAGLFFCSCAVYMGWGQVLVPNPRDTDHICKEMARFRPGFIANVPSLYFLLMSNPKFKALDHSGVEICISAAAPFPEESQRQFEQIVGQNKLLEAYGMSETSPLTVMNPAKGQKKLGAIGVPLPNTDLKLVVPGSGEIAGIGEPGEICVRGPMVMKGYHNNPRETERAVDVEGFMHTGDVAVQDENGFLRIVDRVKDMINVSGFKVFSKKVEETLARHPAIDMIGIVGLPDPEKPGSEIVKAFVMVKQAFSSEPQEALSAAIRSFAKEKLAAYEVPKFIEIRSELPLTAVGKLDKKKLRQAAPAQERRAAVPEKA
jgi:long-chain acyl-CoA synthetase